ncbi:hypothetical protein OC861_004338 [Tilletia horrida]|nr:hypothetical protein OC845_004116 [Tilletia horrida]KAK0564340.1 hypothetical protein OC861_004338 [Tilletia horrida]
MSETEAQPSAEPQAASTPDLTLKESDAPLPAELATTDENSQSATNDGQPPSTAEGAEGAAKPTGKGGRGGAAAGSGQYLNRERFKTGGPQRKPLTEDELSAKLERARLQNAAILARREQVEADKSQYEQLTAQEREERAQHARKKLAEKKAQLVQEEERAKARARKLEKQDTRSWDSEKQEDQLWQSNFRPYAGSGGDYQDSRGGGRGGRGGRGRGSSSRGGASGGPKREPTKQEVNVNDAAQFPALSGGKGTSAKAEPTA